MEKNTGEQYKGEGNGKREGNGGREKMKGREIALHQISGA